MSEVKCDKCKKTIAEGEQYTSVFEEGKVSNYCDKCYKENKKNKVRFMMAQMAEAIINIFEEEK